MFGSSSARATSAWSCGPPAAPRGTARAPSLEPPSPRFRRVRLGATSVSKAVGVLPPLRCPPWKSPWSTAPFEAIETVP